MSPNLLLKSTYVRINDPDNQYYTRNNIVRTDFILENVFAFLLKKYYKFDAIDAMNEREKNIYKSMEKTIDSFRERYAIQVRSLCINIEVYEDNVSSILYAVANELFSEGITWSRIIAFFLFVGELTIMGISRNLPESFIDVMYERSSRLVKEKLESWIEDHDGWEGIKSFSGVAQQESSLKISYTSWSQSVLHKTIITFGTLASIANILNNYI